MTIAVVLVRPREEGNVGAAARAMANMGLDRLILVEPAAQLGVMARAFAVGAGHILEGAVRAPSLRQALAPFTCVVGTTSTRDRRQAVPLIGPRELPDALAAVGAAVPSPGTGARPDPAIALVFGPEVGGLTNDELAFANLVVSVPCAPLQPTLNLAQAVLILAYELYQADLASQADPADRADPAELADRAERDRAAATAPPLHRFVQPPEAAAATSAEVDGLFDHVAELLGRIGFDRDSSFAGVIRDLRAAAARARLASREVAILRGICRRAGHALAGSRQP